MILMRIEAGKRHWQDKMKILDNLPPRHARGCLQNVVRSVIVQLANADIDDRKKVDMLSYLKDNLPCTCPKVEKADAT